jgi:hypothetical protein
VKAMSRIIHTGHFRPALPIANCDIDAESATWRRVSPGVWEVGSARMEERDCEESSVSVKRRVISRGHRSVRIIGRAGR